VGGGGGAGGGGGGGGRAREVGGGAVGGGGVEGGRGWKWGWGGWGDIGMGPCYIARFGHCGERGDDAARIVALRCPCVHDDWECVRGLVAICCAPNLASCEGVRRGVAFPLLVSPRGIVCFH